MNRHFRRLKALHEFRHLHQIEGFTLIELLIGSVLTVIVVSSLAAIALISELRMGRESEVNQALRDNWYRALTFISNEAKQANWILTELPEGTSYPCEGETPASLLVLEGPPDPEASGNPSPLWRVVYGVRENITTSDKKNWRGFNRLVRCGPSFESDSRIENDPNNPLNALAGNLQPNGQPSETVIIDQLAATNINPFQVSLYDNIRDRNAQISLFLSRKTGNTYPPSSSYSGPHTQIQAGRNPGFDVTGNKDCETTTMGGFEEPLGPNCKRESENFRGRTTFYKEYNLVGARNFRVKGSPNSTDIIFLKGTFSSFEPAKAPCNRIKCEVSNGTQNVTITDGNVLVFYDRILRL